jgi:hypothetical protein
LMSSYVLAKISGIMQYRGKLHPGFTGCHSKNIYIA